MASRDYSDSDDEARPAAGPSTSAAPTPQPKSSGPRVKLTFRPNLTHLINDTPKDLHPPSDRSSLSPPPPLTLKLSRPQKVESIQYSDSSDDEDRSSHTAPASHSKRPAKKAKVGTGSPASTSTSKMPSQSNVTSEIPMKKYDWLAPTTIGASHQGPPDRSGAVSPAVSVDTKDSNEGISAGRRLSGWAPGEEYTAQVVSETKKKSRSDKPPGLGKAWRKGIKKGMPMPTKEDIYGSYTPGDATPMTEGSPEPHDPSIPRPPSPPFVKADPAILGFPVFTRPILPPKFNLSTFPKVSPVFSPINGGDVGPFPRKEPVRRWKMKERVLMGIAGSLVRFKTWSKDGPPSELESLVKADREAKELALKKAKMSANLGERPPLNTAISSESVATTNPAGITVSLPDEFRTVTDDGVSEGDGEESVASLSFPKEEVATPPPAPSSSATPTSNIPAKRKIKGPPKPKAGPRKSKLAQEITSEEVVTASDAIEELM